MVTAELGVDTLKRRVTRSLGLRDAILKSAYVVSSNVCLHLSEERTRSCAPCAAGCAARSSLTLFEGKSVSKSNTSCSYRGVGYSLAMASDGRYLVN